MDFTVFLLPAGEAVFTGESRYMVGDTNGVLTVDDVPNERVIVYGPAAWQRVEHAGANHDIMQSTH
jgi:hypothetical protein